MDKLSDQAVMIVGHSQWPSGNSQLPVCADRSVHVYQIIESIAAKKALYTLSVTFFSISCIAAYIAYRILVRNYKPLIEKQIVTFADMLYMAYFVFQPFQLMTEGPDQENT